MAGRLRYVVDAIIILPYYIPLCYMYALRVAELATLLFGEVIQSEGDGIVALVVASLETVSRYRYPLYLSGLDGDCDCTTT